MSSTRAWLSGASGARCALALLLIAPTACAKLDALTGRDSARSANESPIRPSPGAPGGGLVPTLGEACAVDGERGCDGRGSKLALSCSAATWQMAAECDETQACSDRPGEHHGTCRPLITGCDEHPAGEPFCVAGAVRSCLDRVSAEGASCDENAACRFENGSASCLCAPGFQRDTGRCTDIDECAIGTSGCDAEVKCTNLPGSYTCGGCSKGYLGGKDNVCRPALIDLTLLPGALSPVFKPAQGEYAVTVPGTAGSIELTATAPAEATIEVNGTALQSGTPWRSGALALGETELELVVSRAEFPSTTYKLVITRDLGQDAYLKPDNGGTGDLFGGSLALSSDVLVVGAPGEDGGAIDVEGGQSTAVIASGAAYVFEREGNGWVQRAYLKPEVPQMAAGFGAVVAISGDTIVIGAPGAPLTPAQGDGAAARSTYAAGAAYVFVRDGDQWRQQAMLQASNPSAGDAFGNVLAISGDTIIVGAPLEGSDASGIDGEGQKDAAPDSGAAYVFVGIEGIWTQQAFLKAAVTRAGDGFGFAVAIDRDTAVVAALRGSTETGTAAAPEDVSVDTRAPSGEPVPTVLPAATSGAGLAAVGAAYVFTRDGRSWSQTAALTSEAAGSGARFGYSVGVSGDSIVVGAPLETTRTQSEGMAAEPRPVASGAAHVFVRGAGGWTEQAQLVATREPALAAGTAGDNFGASVKIVENAILVGAYGEDSNAAGLNGEQSNAGQPDSGAVYLFTRVADRWSNPVYLKASNARAGDEFARHTALSRNGFAVGTSNEDSGAHGVDGNQADTSAPSSGAVYSFR